MRFEPGCALHKATECAPGWLQAAQPPPLETLAPARATVLPPPALALVAPQLALAAVAVLALEPAEPPPPLPQAAPPAAHLPALVSLQSHWYKHGLAWYRSYHTMSLSEPGYTTRP